MGAALRISSHYQGLSHAATAETVSCDQTGAGLKIGNYTHYFTQFVSIGSRSGDWTFLNIMLCKNSTLND